ncbi:unnamed protein product [marine sediment metagenome]|uniref:Uncharacterized protein n=1 Tax=marine sediment metagenome TaxID=412755 RepID=X1J1X7_9ZZZZ
MARSAPQVSFSVDSVNYGTIDVGNSAATQTYNIYQARTSLLVTEAINMSISFKEDTNASEVRKESWVWISTAALAKTHIGSIGGPEAGIGSIVAGRTSGGISRTVYTGISVPGDAATAGAVTFYLHHRYQYTGDDDD